MTEAQSPAQRTRPWIGYRPSQAALVSMAVGAALIVLFLANWALYRSQPQRVAWSDYMQWPQLLGLSVLWLIVCTMTYWLVRLWHEELPSDDVSIEAAWQAGMKSLRARGHSLEQFPLFLVLGSTGLLHQRQLIEQGGLRLNDDLLPADPDAPMHWAFTDQGVWLFVHGAGTYASLTKRLSVVPASTAWFETSQLFPTASGAMCWDADARPLSASVGSTVVNSEPRRVSTLELLVGQSAPDCGRAAHSVGATSAVSAIQAGSKISQEVTATLELDSESIVSDRSQSRETAQSVDVTLDSLEELLNEQCQAESVVAGVECRPKPSETADQLSSWKTAMAFEVAAQPTLLSSTEITQQQHALQEICRRLCGARRSLVPANGTVAIVDAQQLMAGSVRAAQLGMALRNDLHLIQDALQLQTPTTIWVDGLHELPGTNELVRRGGPELAQADATGAAFPLRYQPQKSLLAHQSQLAVEQIQTRIYRHLHAVASLAQVGNDRLFELLIACRSRLLPSLQVFTGEALGIEYEPADQRDPLLFAGTYFIASGEKATRQAWAGAAFAHVLRSQNMLRWTTQKMRSDRQLKFAISLLKAFCLVMLVILLVILWRAS